MRAIRITQANWLNDQVGGDRGTVKLVQDDMAHEAVEVHKIAVYAPEYDPQPPSLSAGGAQEVQEIPVVTIEPRLDPDDLLDHIEAVADGHPEDSPLVQAELKMPWSNASKAAWVDWAVYQGADSSEAAGMTKNELMSRYGERL